MLYSYNEINERLAKLNGAFGDIRSAHDLYQIPYAKEVIID